MTSYAIAIGGTGARCLENLIHLLMVGDDDPSIEKIKVIIIDPDQTNGNVIRTLNLIKDYELYRTKYFCDSQGNYSSNSKSYKTKIEIISGTGWENGVWTPFLKEDNRIDDNITLSGILKYNTLDPEKKAFLDCLLSKKELNADLKVGFRGHPNIGSITWASAAKNQNSALAKIGTEIENDLLKGEKPRVFLFGSIFGGTGASGFPAIPQLIKKKETLVNLPFGGALLLPYFEFPTDKVPDGTGLFASSNSFLLNTKAALQYYHKLDLRKYYTQMYIIGSENRREEAVFSVGGNKQENKNHPIEMLAALAALRFYKNTDSENRDDTALKIIGRSELLKMKWIDFPGVNTDTYNYQQMKSFLLKSIFISKYLELIVEDFSRTKKIHLLTFLKTFSNDFGQQPLDEFKKFTQFIRENNLRWFDDLNSTSVPKSELFNSAIIEKLPNPKSGLTSEEFENVLNINSGYSDVESFGTIVMKLNEMRINEGERPSIALLINKIYSMELKTN